MSDKDKKEEVKPTAYTGTVKVTVRGEEFYAHITPPPPAAGLPDLEKALEINRKIIDESQMKLKEVFYQEAFEQAAPWQLNYKSPIQDAITAHLNINILIPLINIRGGEARFQKPETFHVKQRLELMRNIAEKATHMEQTSKHRPFNIAVIIVLVLVVILAVTVLPKAGSL